MKLLLHTCCGPCFLGVWEDLKEKDIEVSNYFYNPNIWPQEEYEKRKLNLQKITNDVGTEMIEGDYDPGKHAEAIVGKEDQFPERCLDCYRLRLEETASHAKKFNYEYFSTTLLVSPYQNHQALADLGNEIAKDTGTKFYYTDWRPFFRPGQDLAKKNDLYRQKYCGCKYSLKK